MGFCCKHNEVECRFFCSTCSVPVCHLCMERGDHVIPKHDCIPLKRYCETKRDNIRTVLEEATKHKIQYDKINSKWDMHLTFIAGEFEKLKNDIVFAKLHLLQQLDLEEQLHMKAAGIEKAQTEAAIKLAQCSHAQSFSGVYQQLNDKCQFLLQNTSHHNFVENEGDFQECRNLLRTLQQVLTNFEKDDLLGMNLAFVPSKVCILGKVVDSKDTDHLGESTSDSFDTAVTGEPRNKCIKTDQDEDRISVKKEKVDTPKYNADKSLHCRNDQGTLKIKAKQSSHDVNSKSKPILHTKPLIQDGRIKKAYKTHTTKSNKNGDMNVAIKTEPTESNNDGGLSMPDIRQHISTHSHSSSATTPPSLNARSPVANKRVNENRVDTSKMNITVAASCSGIVWANQDWLLELSTTKACIKVKYHNISDRSQSHPDTTIHCKQNMKDVDLRVCPKVHPPDCTFIVAFRDQIVIIGFQNTKARAISWRHIENTHSILAISWRLTPSNYVAIVEGLDGHEYLVKHGSETSATPQFEVRKLSNIGLLDYHPVDVTANDEFAVCNTFSSRILFFSSFDEVTPTRQVLAPSCLTDGKPLSISIIEDKREWFALWKGKSSCDGQPKWALVRYNASFEPSSIVLQCTYRRLHEEPKAFCVRNNQSVILHNSLNVSLHTGLYKSS